MAAAAHAGESPATTPAPKRKMRLWLKILIGVAVALVLLMGAGMLWGMSYMGYFNPGNSSDYDLENVEVLDDSPLEGLTIGQLGSSVTYGMQSMGVSFADYIAWRNNCTTVKEAVSGTTLVTSSENSYVERLLTMDTSTDFDIMMVQLSTNDAGDDPSPIGEVSDSYDLEDFDTTTVIGAIEYIIAYSLETWDCEVVFYTCAPNSKAGYEDMVDALYEVAEKWDITIIDLYNTLDSDSVDLDTFMNDEIHPTKLGYLEWWTPVMEEALYALVEGE